MRPISSRWDNSVATRDDLHALRVIGASHGCLLVDPKISEEPAAGWTAPPNRVSAASHPACWGGETHGLASPMRTSTALAIAMCFASGFFSSLSGVRTSRIPSPVGRRNVFFVGSRG